MPQICHAHCPDEGGGLAAVVLVAAAVVLGAIAAVLDDIVVTLAIAAAVAVAGSLAILVWVLRRGHGTVSTGAPQLPLRARGAIPAAARPAIGQHRVLPGVVISERGHDIPVRRSPGAATTRPASRG